MFCTFDNNPDKLRFDDAGFFGCVKLAPAFQNASHNKADSQKENGAADHSRHDSLLGTLFFDAVGGEILEEISADAANIADNMGIALDIYDEYMRDRGPRPQPVTLGEGGLLKSHFNTPDADNYGYRPSAPDPWLVSAMQPSDAHALRL